ncbi:MAG: hypothetical protein JWN57_1884 [Frankiales bacterium]|nr:hypothetical protein [Frankiales bacterium]
MTGDRVLATAVTLGIVVLAYLLMLKGWRGRQRRQGDLPPPPPAPQTPGLVVVGATPGLFVGTVFADDWLDRVAVHGLSDRSAGWLTVRTDGLVVEREGDDDLYLPYALVDAAEPGDALAGKVVGRDGMLLITWRLGGRSVRSGFRADDHAAHRRLADAVHAHLPITSTTTQEERA